MNDNKYIIESLKAAGAGINKLADFSKDHEAFAKERATQTHHLVRETIVAIKGVNRNMEKQNKLFKEMKESNEKQRTEDRKENNKLLFKISLVIAIAILVATGMVNGDVLAKFIG